MVWGVSKGVEGRNRRGLIRFIRHGRTGATRTRTGMSDHRISAFEHSFGIDRFRCLQGRGVPRAQIPAAGCRQDPRHHEHATHPPGRPGFGGAPRSGLKLFGSHYDTPSENEGNPPDSQNAESHGDDTVLQSWANPTFSTSEKVFEKKLNRRLNCFL